MHRQHASSSDTRCMMSSRLTSSASQWDTKQRNLGSPLHLLHMAIVDACQIGELVAKPHESAMQLNCCRMDMWRCASGCWRGLQQAVALLADLTFRQAACCVRCLAQYQQLPECAGNCRQHATLGCLHVQRVANTAQQRKLACSTSLRSLRLGKRLLVSQLHYVNCRSTA
jgi:hypothetical protein